MLNFSPVLLLFRWPCVFVCYTLGSVCICTLLWRFVVTCKMFGIMCAWQRTSSRLLTPPDQPSTLTSCKGIKRANLQPHILITLYRKQWPGNGTCTVWGHITRRRILRKAEKIIRMSHSEHCTGNTTSICHSSRGLVALLLCRKQVHEHSCHYYQTFCPQGNQITQHPAALQGSPVLFKVLVVPSMTLALYKPASDTLRNTYRTNNTSS